jgi:DNA-binding MarR family transcriptional regulator
VSGSTAGSGQPRQRAAGDDVEEPTTRIAFIVRLLANALNQQIEQALRPVGLTQAQLAALAQLAASEQGWLSGAELGRRAGVTAQAMSSALAGIEARGLVRRGPHPSRGRVIRVWTTDEGRQLVATAQRLTAPVDARAQALLSTEERRQLRDLLLRAISGAGVQAPVLHGSDETG